MISVNSVSGGKTSSYMLIKYPADYNIFSLVRSNYKSIAPKDVGITKEIQKRIPNFIASTESDLTLKLILDLEQFSGKKITWVTADKTFEDFALKKVLPNSFMRICTEQLKINAIHNFIHLNILSSIDDKVEMRIGFRKDEDHRAFEWEIQEKDFIKYPISSKIKTKRKNWIKLNWRVSRFPLIEDGITKLEVNNFWKDKSLTFPLISNCVGCFFHRNHELQLNWKIEREKMQYFSSLEDISGRTFKKGINYKSLEDSWLIEDFEFSKKPCISGFCGI